MTTSNLMNENNYPKLHNATWPGVVGKGPDSEPVIAFDTMLEMTAAAEVDGVKFDGVDLALFEHIDVNISDDDIKQLADKVGGYNLKIGSLVAPIWGGPAMGSKEDRTTFVEMVRKSCHIGQKLTELGIRPKWRGAHRLGQLAPRLGCRPGWEYQTHCPNLPRSLRCSRRIWRETGR